LYPPRIRLASASCKLTSPGRAASASGHRVPNCVVVVGRSSRMATPRFLPVSSLFLRMSKSADFQKVSVLQEASGKHKGNRSRKNLPRKHGRRCDCRLESRLWVPGNAAIGRPDLPTPFFAAQQHEATQGSTLVEQVEQPRGALHGRGARQFSFEFVVKGDPLCAPCMGSLCQGALSDHSAGSPPVGY
jgi:hypothetical protein